MIDERRRRCACGRWFVFARATRRHCSKRCRDTAAQRAKRDRAADAPRVPIAVQLICSICRRPFLATVRRGGTVQRYDRLECKRIAEKIAALSADETTTR